MVYLMSWYNLRSLLDRIIFKTYFEIYKKHATTEGNEDIKSLKLRFKKKRTGKKRIFEVK